MVSSIVRRNFLMCLIIYILFLFILISLNHSNLSNQINNCTETNYTDSKFCDCSHVINTISYFNFFATIIGFLTTFILIIIVTTNRFSNLFCINLSVVSLMTYVGMIVLIGVITFINMIVLKCLNFIRTEEPSYFYSYTIHICVIICLTIIYIIEKTYIDKILGGNFKFQNGLMRNRFSQIEINETEIDENNPIMANDNPPTYSNITNKIDNPPAYQVQ
jgi:hypothetical protein